MSGTPHTHDPPSRPWLPWVVAIGGVWKKRKAWRTVGNRQLYNNPSSLKTKHFTWADTRFESSTSTRRQLIKRVKMSYLADSKKEEEGGRAINIGGGSNVYHDESATRAERGDAHCDSEDSGVDGTGEGANEDEGVKLEPNGNAES